MDPPEETAFTAAEKSELQTIITEAVATALRSFEPPASTPHILARPGKQKTWVFPLDLLTKRIRSERRSLIKPIQRRVSVPGHLVMLKRRRSHPREIHASLHGSALALYCIGTCRWRMDGSLCCVNGFRMRPSQVLVKLANTTFSSTDVRAGKSMRGFAS